MLPRSGQHVLGPGNRERRFLLLQRFHEAFATGVVIRIPRPTYARNHSMVSKHLNAVSASILNAPVRMWSSLPSNYPEMPVVETEPRAALSVPEADVWLVSPDSHLRTIRLPCPDKLCTTVVKCPRVHCCHCAQHALCPSSAAASRLILRFRQEKSVSPSRLRSWRGVLRHQAFPDLHYVA